MKKAFGFTLAELLIALAILGMIATFTIPKVLSSQQDGKYKAMGKETAAAISGAYEAYRLNNTPTTTTKPIDLLPYFNYVRRQTSGSIDDVPTSGTISCSASEPCLVLHNGGTLILRNYSFSGTATTNALTFNLDPDGVGTGVNKSVEFELYYNGRLSTWGTALPNSTSSWGSWGPDPTKDPPWFSWN